MENNDISIEQIKEEIKKLKFEIIEKENKIAELLKVIEGDNEDDYIIE
ncbi:MAG: hypothetical protein IK137_01790 [Bacilli bacterium]|nr:hypothetical protein [Bacilli bacterium]